MSIHPRWERWALSAFLALFFLLQLAISLRINLNWDEYYFLSHIYAFADGRLSEPFQTFHVRLLPWLTWLPVSDPDQLVAGRLFMMACEAGSLFCLYRIAREFVSIENGLFAVAAWCAAGHALLHGASFRADPLAGVLMMASLALLMCGRLGWKQAAAAGVLAATGLLVTIKGVFLAPAFLGALVWRWQRAGSKGAALRHLALSVTALFVASAVLWVLHTSNLSTAIHSAAAAQAPSSTLPAGNGVLNKVILSQALFPRADYIVEWAMVSVFSLFLCAAGLWNTAKRGARPGTTWPFLPVLLFAAPLLSLAVYRNAFPYFFPFIMLPVALSAGLGAEAMKRPLLRSAVLIGMTVPLMMSFAVWWQRDQSAQREIASVAHELFPEPVPYIDRNGMLPSFPKAGFFMSTWGIESYLTSRRSVLAQAIMREQPPLLILNSPLLQDAVDPQGVPLPWHLLPRDAEALRSNYIEHWGPIWVAGKALSTGAGDFDILIGGTYTLQCQGRRQIDGADVPCNATMNLSPGAHRWAGGEGTLRWSDHLPVPAQAPPTEPIYYGF